MNHRLTSFTNWLREQNHEAAFITSTPNVFYLSGFYSDPHERLLGLMVFPNEEPILVCPKMEVSDAKTSGWSYEIIGYDDSEHPWELIKNLVHKKEVSPGSVAIEKSHLSFERAEELQTVFPNTTFANAEEKLQVLRMIKDEKEVHILKQAAKLADFGVEVGVNSVASGKTEMDILATIEYELKKKGIREMSFATMVLSGHKTASPHGTPGLDTIKKGDFVLFDLGVVLDGYCSDITRTVVYGEPTEKQNDIYNTVLSAQKSAVDICKPGTKIGTVDQTARNIITNAGYEEFFTHRIGHGLGIEVHEYPSMSSNNDNTLQTGMTFTIEPGIYVPGVGGVRIEDDLLITDDGVESLTSFPKELQIIK